MAIQFYRQNAWWLGTGLVFTFGSSFGQTYFISFFAGGIREEFGLSNGEWGGLYTIATFASAALLMHLGRLADTVNLAKLAAAILLVYAAAALIMASSVHVLMLLVGVFGLRFCGQGMMTHLGMTAMARWFRANRARAMAIAALGFPFGEAMFPLVAVGVIDAVGWRTGWVLVACLIAAVLLPLCYFLTRHGRSPQGEGGADTATGMEGRHWTRREVLRHFSFWLVLPGMIAPPFIGTCVVFHQVHISEVRGYDLSTMALAFPFYAAISVTTALISGPLVDRIGSTRLLPVFLLPITAAMLVLAIPGGIWVWFATLMCAGLGQGLMVTIIGSLWPTLYGTRWIGSIKSLSTATLVVATALGPGITGFIIDWGYTFPQQAPFLAAYCVAASLIFLITAPRLTRAIAAAPASAAAPA